MVGTLSSASISPLMSASVISGATSRLKKSEGRVMSAAMTVIDICLKKMLARRDGHSSRASHMMAEKYDGLR